MIMFDYGQTLIAEDTFNPLKGNRAVLDLAIKNPNNVTEEQVQELANSLSKEMIESFPNPNRHYQPLEMTSKAFDKYLYDYLGVELNLSQDELEWTFCNNASPGRPTKNVQKMLTFLQENNIRIAIISNMMNSSVFLTRRLNELLPNNNFEFIITSSDYMFRKPHHRIFDLALTKAKLDPEDVYFCGDNLYCDIEGAYQMGMKAFWYPPYIDRDYQVSTKANYITINDWEDLINLIKEDM
jgi:putative hydrolase of the HAD superfamily